jgi:hypothetical protein
MRSPAFALVLLPFFLGYSESAAAIRGDCDNDGRLTARDAEAALQMSAGLRSPMSLLDMDGDGRVMSADARIILQNSEKAAGPIAASRASTPTLPSASNASPFLPAPAAKQSAPFYIAFAIYLPGNIEGLNKHGAEKMDRQAIQKLKEELAAADIGRVQFKADKTPLLLHVRDAGLNVYSPSQFRPGERFAVRVAVDYKGVTREPMKGALLLETISIFQSQNEVQTRYPNARFDGAAPAASGKGDAPLVLTADQTDGAFHHASKSGDMTFAMRTERLEKGWSEEMKRQNVQLLIAALDLCASQTALIGDPAAAKKLAILRHFRDETLARTETGRELIRFYYEQFSPWAKTVMQEYEGTRPLFRGAFDFIIILSLSGEQTLHETKI